MHPRELYPRDVTYRGRIRIHFRDDDGKPLHDKFPTSKMTVMIAQWENECISLSVLSVARVMIAQWENECISLSVLSVEAKTHDITPLNLTSY